MRLYQVADVSSCSFERFEANVMAPRNDLPHTSRLNAVTQTARSICSIAQEVPVVFKCKLSAKRKLWMCLCRSGFLNFNRWREPDATLRGMPRHVGAARVETYCYQYRNEVVQVLNEYANGQFLAAAIATRDALRKKPASLRASLNYQPR